MSFFNEVYQIARQVPKGKVTTYGEMAKALGTKDARKVGWALHANSDPQTPCHRVVNKDGKLAANFAFGGEAEQKRRLLVEGITFKGNKVDLEKHLWVAKR
ncbi:hypothetical protein A2597_02655 [Candidatus Woesebacteria bacterium RIFOXYD1_FULL_46_19]|uniref:Methylated-DNA-[protein]-cysteine S-methyltransferase DNA binding domain-containing protein n=1 Tax=Candidatus Woesebacteria bacterium RIFOXYD1_FULL_46_19 TaxID=1802552 RepID=A0A1F8DNI0_9BACT|nr:MAG: hypothetical protein A2597_02655 [Candidatus Woesebacteria bacterium RIFOXYD1_FULL_46_19]